MKNLLEMSATTPAITRDDLDAYVQAERMPFNGIRTPLSAWSLACDRGGGKREGLARGWLVTLAGTTGQGKSWLGANLSACAIRQGYSVTYITGELGRLVVAERIGTCLHPSVTFAEQNGNPEWIYEVADELGSVYVNDIVRPINVRQVFESIDLFRGAQNDLVIVDYATAVLESATKTADELRDFVIEFKARAVEQQFVAVIVSQIKRDRNTTGPFPDLTDLDGGRFLENHSDQVMLFGYESVVPLEPALRRDRRQWLRLAKNRFGSKGTVPVVWDRHSMRIRQGEPTVEGEWPKSKVTELYRPEGGQP